MRMKIFFQTYKENYPETHLHCLFSSEINFYWKYLNIILHNE